MHVLPGHGRLVGDQERRGRSNLLLVRELFAQRADDSSDVTGHASERFVSIRVRRMCSSSAVGPAVVCTSARTANSNPVFATTSSIDTPSCTEANRAEFVSGSKSKTHSGVMIDDGPGFLSPTVAR